MNNLDWYESIELEMVKKMKEDKKMERKAFETFAHYKLGGGYATLSVSVNEGAAKVGVSFCSPRDQFIKDRGRKVATTRRDLGAEVSYTFGFKRDQKAYPRLCDQLINEFKTFVAMKRDGKRMAPRWAVRKAAQLEIKVRKEQPKVLSKMSCCIDSL